MFAYDDLKERVPEKEEVMSGKEALQYFKDKTRPKPKPGYYDFIVADILNKTKIKEGKVLDIGCGGGGLLRELKKTKLGLKLFGIDASKTLISASKKYFPENDIQIKYSKAENTTYKDNLFDLVICQDTFHHFTNPVKVLKEMYRVTKKGGIIYIVDLRRDIDKRIIELATKGIIRYSITHTLFYLASVKAAYTVPEVEKLIKKARITDFKIYNGKNEAHIRKLIKRIFDEDRKEGLNKAFKERWFSIIKK